MSDPNVHLCTSLSCLKHELKTLEVDCRLLEIMQKWGCFAPHHAQHLQGKSEEDRLDSMMRILQNQVPATWPLLVCVFLETNRDSMAMSSWRAVKEHIRQMQVKGKQQEARDLWEAFVRQMSVHLVLDQRHKPNSPTATSPTAQDPDKSVGNPALDQQEDRDKSVVNPALAPLGDEQRETASSIWSEIMKEAAHSTEHCNKDLKMWEIFVNCVSNGDFERNHDLWKNILAIVLDTLEGGEPKKTLKMYECLVEKTNRKVFSRGWVQQMLQMMTDFMLEVQDGKQKYFVKTAREVLMKHFCRLFRTPENRASAIDLLEILSKSIPKFLAKDAGGAAKTLCKELAGLIERLSAENERSTMFTNLCQMVRDLSETEPAFIPLREDLEALRETLSSGTSLVRSNASSYMTEDEDMTSSYHSCLDTPFVNNYPIRPQSSGLALVINNMDFSEADYRRTGSSMDELALPVILRKLGFSVQQERNLSKDGLHRAIASFATRPEHREPGVAAVLALMTHGRDEGLLGTDGEVLAFQKVVECFSDGKAPNLAGKPKWLSFQACREKSNESHHRPNERWPLDLSNVQIGDLFITFTALSGCTAKRHEAEGTLYVQALKEALDMSQALRFSLFELHIKVQEIMHAMWRKEKARTPENKLEELGTEPRLEIRTLGWTKKLYLKSASDS